MLVAHVCAVAAAARWLQQALAVVLRVDQRQAPLGYFSLQKDAVQQQSATVSYSQPVSQLQSTSQQSAAGPLGYFSLKKEVVQQQSATVSYSQPVSQLP